MMLAVASEDIGVALQALHDQWAGELAPEAVLAASQAVDLDAAEATCPACGATFPTSRARCSSCGLRLG